jgi:hypothetical protein
LGHFAEIFFETIKKISEKGLSVSEEHLLDNAIESQLRSYRNTNSEIVERTNNNRLLLLMEN